MSESDPETPRQLTPEELAREARLKILEQAMKKAEQHPNKNVRVLADGSTIVHEKENVVVTPKGPTKAA